MQVNKLLVKSLLESSGWVDRIAADPERERKAKMSNAKSNALQHSKLDFATKAKADDPRISFGNLTTSSATSIYPATKRIRRDSERRANSVSPQQPTASESGHYQVRGQRLDYQYHRQPQFENFASNHVSIDVCQSPAILDPNSSIRTDTADFSTARGNTFMAAEPRRSSAKRSRADFESCVPTDDGSTGCSRPSEGSVYEERCSRGLICNTAITNVDALSMSVNVTPSSNSNHAYSKELSTRTSRVDVFAPVDVGYEIDSIISASQHADPTFWNENKTQSDPAMYPETITSNRAHGGATPDLDRRSLLRTAGMVYENFSIVRAPMSAELMHGDVASFQCNEDGNLDEAARVEASNSAFPPGFWDGLGTCMP